MISWYSRVKPICCRSQHVVSTSVRDFQCHCVSHAWHPHKQRSQKQTWSVPWFHRVCAPAIVSFLWRRHPGVVLPCLGYHCDHSLTQTHIQCESKKFNPDFFSDIFFQNGWEFLVQILHTYYTFLFTLHYKFLSNYLQLRRSYNIVSATTITCSKCPPSAKTHTGWSHLIWHNFITVGESIWRSRVTDGWSNRRTESTTKNSRLLG